MNERIERQESSAPHIPRQEPPDSTVDQIKATLGRMEDGFVILSKNGIEYANHAVSVLLGIPLEELQDKGFSWATVLYPTERDKIQRIVNGILEGVRASQKVKFTAMTRHRGERHFSVSLTRTAGEAESILGIVADITQHIHSDSEWKLRAKLHEDIVRASRLMLIKDLDIPSLHASMEILMCATQAERICLHATTGAPLESANEIGWNCIGEKSDLPPLPIPLQWRTMLANDLPVSIITIDLPTEEQRPLEARGIRALLAVPLRAGNVCRGFLRFDRTTSDTMWSPDTITVLKTGVSAWGSALALAETQVLLKASEARFRRLVENSQDMIYRMTLPEGRYEYISPAVLDMTGHTTDEFMAKPKLIQDIIHPGWWNYLQTQWDRLLNGDVAPTFEYAIIHGRTGETRWLFQRNVVLTDDAGAPTMIEGIVTDITARKRAEMALRTQQSLLQSVFQVAPVGIGLVSDRTLLHVNQHLCDMTGYSREELIGRNARLLYPTEADYNYVGESKYDQIRQQGSGTVEARWQRKDGRIIDILLSSIPLDTEDLTAGVTFTALDITDRKYAEDQIRASLQQKELLLKEIHHRVKNNLAVISSLLGLQAQQTADPHATTILRKSRDRVYAMAHVHEHLYKSADVARVDMQDLVATLVNDALASHTSSVGTTVHVSARALSIDQATPCSLILNELVANALEHAFNDAVNEQRFVDLAPHITVEMHERDAILTLVVADNGIGMPDGARRNRPATLGLDIVGVLVSQLGGRYNITTNQGTRIEITFPRGAP